MGDSPGLGRSFPLKAGGNFTETGGLEYQATIGDLLSTSSIMLIMSVIPIVSGSFRSVDNRGRAETLSTRDAMMAPVALSCALCSLYAWIGIFGARDLDTVATYFFSVIGVFVLVEIVSFTLRRIVPGRLIDNDVYTWRVRRASTNSTIFDVSFDHYDIMGVIVAVMSGLWYLAKNHWIASNLLGIALAHSGIAYLHLNSATTACILFGGLVTYDAFWVYWTNVMEAVAVGFGAPVKLQVLWGKHFTMIGLGDIVLPGLFIALLLRYDLSKGTNSRLYFNLSLAAYVLGCVLTSVAAIVLGQSLPTLLFVVPLCTGLPISVAIFKGEIKSLFLYRDVLEEKSARQLNGVAAARAPLAKQNGSRREKLQAAEITDERD